MPRDGSHNYNLPFPDVVADTVIESAVYNGFTNDVALDLNTPRPIAAGGTGASNGRDAMINLKGEVSGEVVTNYDSHPFIAGSFLSAGTATGGPIVDHDFSGICHVNGADITLEARDYDDTAVPGRKYIRQKIGGTWNPWRTDTPFVLASVDPPVGAPDNTLWFDLDSGLFFFYVNDGTSTQWVEVGKL